jgi:hypothetical protein
MEIVEWRWQFWRVWPDISMDRPWRCCDRFWRRGPKAGVDLFWSFLSVGHTETTRSVVYLVEVAAALALPAALTLSLLTALALLLLAALPPLLAATATTSHHQ